MRRRALHASCIALLLVTAGCIGFPGGGGGGAEAESKDTEKLVADAQRAMASADTYRMNMSMYVAADGDSYDVRRVGVFDATEKQARLNLGTGENRTLAYLDGSTMYVNSSGEWQTRTLPGDGSWKSAVGLAQQHYLLENASVTVAGSATVDGVETTVLNVDPKDGKLKQLLTRSTSGSLGHVTIEESSYELYVAEDSHRPRKVDMTLQLSVGESPWGNSGHGSATITFSEFGQPVNVTVPVNATS